jgi:hypothetical protein
MTELGVCLIAFAVGLMVGCRQGYRQGRRDAREFFEMTGAVQ